MPGWGEEHERSPESEREAMVRDCVDAMHAALVVYDEAIRTIGQARSRLAMTILTLQGADVNVPEIIEFGPLSGRTQEEAEALGRRLATADQSRLKAGWLVIPEDVRSAPGA